MDAIRIKDGVIGAAARRGGASGVLRLKTAPSILAFHVACMVITSARDEDCIHIPDFVA